MELKDIKELIKALDDSSIAKLELVQGDHVIMLEKERNEPTVLMAQGAHPTPTVASMPMATSEHLEEAPIQNVSEEKSMESVTAVLAPLVGVFYQAASPDSDPFVKVGQAVNKGDTICILEAMKVLNEIKAPVSGVVKQVYVNNGDVVEFDQLLMEIGD